MSIILEALKKASVSRNAPSLNSATTVKIHEEKVEAKEDDLRDVTGFSLPRISLMGTAAVVIVGLVAFLMFRQTGTPQKDKIPSGPASALTTKGKMTAEGYSTAPVPAAPKQDATPISSFITKLSNPRLSLNGIVYGIGKPAAIIENKILEEGASIRGAKIVKIHEDNVEMLDEATGQAFVLKVD